MLGRLLGNTPTALDSRMANELAARKHRNDFSTAAQASASSPRLPQGELAVARRLFMDLRPTSNAAPAVKIQQPFGLSRVLVSPIAKVAAATANLDDDFVNCSFG